MSFEPANMQWNRISIVIICLVISFIAVGWLRRDYNAVGDQPTIPLSQIPVTLGPWRGEEVSMTDETSEALGADVVVNRSYVDDSGNQVSMHAAGWINRELFSSAPHHPEVCYPAAGWTLVERRPAEVESDGATFAVELMHFKRSYQEVITCHWFQMGDVHYRNEFEFQSLRPSFWGAKSWPNTYKVLLSVPGYSIDRAQPVLFDLANHIHHAMLELKDGATDAQPNDSVPARNNPSTDPLIEVEVVPVGNAEREQP